MWRMNSKESNLKLERPFSEVFAIVSKQKITKDGRRYKEKGPHVGGACPYSLRSCT